MTEINISYYLKSYTAKLQYLSDYSGNLTHVGRYFEINNKAKKEAAVLSFVMKGGDIYANTYI